MGKDVIVACDFSGKKEVLDFLDKFGGRKPFVKIGMELFYAEGWYSYSTMTCFAQPLVRYSHM